MSHPETTTAIIAAALAGPLAERQLALLARLNEIGLEVAEATGRRAKAAPENEDISGVAMAYARTARAVRQTALLECKIVADLHEFEAETVRRTTAAATAAEEALELAQSNHKARVERIVERAAEARHGDDEERVERLVMEAAERLDDVDMYGDVLAHSVADLAAEICGDLDLEPDWPKGAKEAWSSDRGPALVRVSNTSSTSHGDTHLRSMSADRASGP